MAEAPRWRLMTPHYLNVPGTEWEYTEITKEGRQGRKRFVVPQLLDPKDPANQNYRETGDLIVTWNNGDRVQPRDIIFIGNPTPDMEPLNDAAEQISASFADKWKHPIDTLAMNGGFSASLLGEFEKQLASAISRAGGIPTAPNVPAAGVDPAVIDEMKAQIDALMKSNADLQAKLTERRV